MTTLHLGTRDADALIALLPSRDVTIHRDGDGWETWGEGSDTEPEHLVIVGDDSTLLLTDVAWILNQEPSLLVPMEHMYQAGTVACITTDADWSLSLYSVIDEQARRRILRDCLHPATIPVPSTGRFARVLCRECNTEFTPEGARP